MIGSIQMLMAEIADWEEARHGLDEGTRAALARAHERAPFLELGQLYSKFAEFGFNNVIFEDHINVLLERRALAQESGDWIQPKKDGARPRRDAPVRDWKNEGKDRGNRGDRDNRDRDNRGDKEFRGDRDNRGEYRGDRGEYRGEKEYRGDRRRE